MQFFTRNLNILLVLKFERLMMYYHRLFEKNAFYSLQKNAKKSKKYLTYISTKMGLISKNFFTKMISTKSSTNPESFIKFGRGRRVDLATSHGYT
jgi:hypothetical protein